MSMLNRTARIALLVLTGGSLFAGQALGNPAMGTNSELSSSGKIYIPLQPSTSGDLGDLFNGGPKKIGRFADSVTLVGIGATTTGSLNLVINFDLAAELEDPTITSGTLMMVFKDLDFLPEASRRLLFSESLDMSVFVGASQLGNSLVVDDTNYDDPAFNATLLGKHGDVPAGPGFNTNKQKVRYEFDMANSFGLTAPDFAAISAAGEFDLHMILYATPTRLVKGRGRVRNTSENINTGDFTFVAVPEPGTIALLAMGGLAIAVRQARRQLQRNPQTIGEYHEYLLQ